MDDKFKTGSQSHFKREKHNEHSKYEQQSIRAYLVRNSANRRRTYVSNWIHQRVWPSQCADSSEVLLLVLRIWDRMLFRTTAREKHSLPGLKTWAHNNRLNRPHEARRLWVCKVDQSKNHNQLRHTCLCRTGSFETDRHEFRGRCMVSRRFNSRDDLRTDTISTWWHNEAVRCDC